MTRYTCYLITRSGHAIRVPVIEQVDINRELVSLLSTGPLALYCLFTNDLMLYCMMLINLLVMLCRVNNTTFKHVKCRKAILLNMQQQMSTDILKMSLYLWLTVI